jgi:protease IV
MKQFLKFTLASTLGICIAGVLLFLILLGIASAFSNSSSAVKIEDNSILSIKLEGDVQEQSIENPFDFSIPGLPIDTKNKNQGLDDILAAIEKAKGNSQIKGIYLEAKTFGAGFASAEEIRNALLDFKKSGKFILAYGDIYDQKEYFICSVADKIFINPEGMMNFCGLASQPIFFKGTLDKLGVKAEVFKVGTFKSAVEPYINTKMSDANRLQTKEYIGGIWGHLLKEISASRKISVEKLNAMANQNMLFEAAGTLVAGHLVDSLLYETGMMNYLAKRVGTSDPDDLNLVTVSDMATIPDSKKSFEKEKVAVLYAEGEIYDTGTEGIVTGDFIKEVRKIQKDSLIKAVVLRVNSPGGSAFASEQIWKALSELKAVKPVVVSMGNLAASGGYYISCNANKIIASPNTLTGSIGIFGTFFIIDEMTKKLGLSFDVVKTNELSDLGNINRPMTTVEKMKIQNYVNRGYDLFVKRCSDGRKIKDKDLRKIAEGRVWTGKKAVELGLADEVGGINRAIEVAAQLGKVKKYRMVYFPEKKDFLTEIIKEVQGDAKMRMVRSFLGEEYTPLLKLKESKIQTGILARMEDVDIH